MKEFIKKSIADFKKVPSWLVALSVVTTVLMNLLANKTLYNDGRYLSLDCGYLISWVMFLVMDIITQRYGGKASFSVTIFDVLVALFMSSLMFGIAQIPETSVSGWFQSPDAVEALNGVVGNSYLVVLTSLLAYVCSSGVDVITNVALGKVMSKKVDSKSFITYFVRAYGSTFVSQFTDNLVFTSIAYPLLFGMECSVLSIVLGALLGAVVELVFELIFAPIGYCAIRKKGE